MADLSSTRRLVLDRAERLHAEATRRLLEDLAREVPDSDEARARDYPAGAYPQRFPKLRTSQEVEFRHSATRRSVVVRYTAPQADFTEYGTAPHRIEPKGPGYPLRFYWPKIPGWVAMMVVNHPGSHRHDGWFSSVCARWPRMLRHAQGA